ncbi:MAG: glycerol-3-phosphate dehydrogenase [Chloroflexia bacterium]|nr:glycerol-3-phosphate dehydrogenase [Chloroflexia bacterium]
MTNSNVGILDQPFDLIVIGAGINGTGIARDAALRGLRVLLLDKTDIAAGTTSWSSRLIHGGLRYLEHAEVGLVRESLRERERLLRIAPHLVRPLPLTIPLYEHHRRGPLLIRAGMIAYDVLSWDKSLPRHAMMSREQALRGLPGLNPQGLRGAARYYDAQVEFPERIAVENALDALAHGALVLPKARVDRLLVEAGVVRGVEFVDDGSGARHAARATVTINVSGPWVDHVLADLGMAERPPPLIGGTKGSHIVVAPFANAPTDALYIEAKEDSRPFFIIPWNGLYLIGTTDVRYRGNPDAVAPSEDEIAYLLRETNQVLPDASLDRGDVLYAYAGIRPLPNQPADSEARISRRHMVHDHAPRVEGLLSIVGGKLTTFRELAEQAVEVVFTKLGRRAPASRTAVMPLPGGVRCFPAFAERFRASAPSWLDAAAVDELVRIYGIRARDVVALAEQAPDLRQRLSPTNPLIGAALIFAFRSERATTLVDALLRRTMAGYGPDVGLEALPAAAQLCQTHLGWTKAGADAEVERYRQEMERFFPQASRTLGI